MKSLFRLKIDLYLWNLKLSPYAVLLILEIVFMCVFHKCTAQLRIQSRCNKQIDNIPKSTMFSLHIHIRYVMHLLVFSIKKHFVTVKQSKRKINFVCHFGRTQNKMHSINKNRYYFRRHTCDFFIRMSFIVIMHRIFATWMSRRSDKVSSSFKNK